MKILRRRRRRRKRRRRTSESVREGHLEWLRAVDKDDSDQVMTNEICGAHHCSHIFIDWRKREI